jgi:hypothetical protein
MIKKATSNKNICSNCIGEFDPKDIFTARVPDREYSTDYCEKCLKELGIKEFEPYLKPRAKRVKKYPIKKTTKKKTVVKKITNKRIS